MRDDFAIFIMVHGRPDRMWTLPTLRKHGYTGKVYLVADDLDETRHEYKKKYGDDLIIFDKKKAAALYDSGDNSGDLRSTMYSANTIPRLAKERGIKYFMIMCDDYTAFMYTFNKDYEYRRVPIFNLDAVIGAMIEFFKSTGVQTLAMAQGGDFMGGAGGGESHRQLMRKAMNTFLCSTEKPIKFIGRLNEDVTTYTRMGHIGRVFFSLTDIGINQHLTQSENSGLTEVYVDAGTYVKSFFSVMYNPSCVKVSMMGRMNQRIHHAVQWKNAVPKIIEEKHRKQPSDK